jgi:hypothetical protein
MQFVDSWRKLYLLADQYGVVMTTAQTEAGDRAIDRINDRIAKSTIRGITVTKRQQPVTYTAIDGTVYQSKPVGDLRAQAVIVPLS